MGHHINMSIETYYNDHIKSSIVGLKNKRKAEDSSEEPMPKNMKHDTSNANSKTEDNDATSQSQIMQWAERCTYSCKICGKFSSTNRKKHAQHLFKCHNKMKVKKYITEYGSTMTNRVMHECKFCKAEITHTRDTIQNHLT